MQTELNQFIQDAVLDECCNLTFNELTIEQLTQLKLLVETRLVSKTKYAEDHQYLITLFREMDALVEQACKYDMWDELWDNFWEVSKMVSDIVEIEYYDPDTSCEEDMMARYNAVSQYVEEREEENL